MHEGIIQAIYGVGLSLESALHSIDEDPEDAKARVHRSIESLDHAIRDLCAYILDLRPRQIGKDGLLRALNRLAIEFQANMVEGRVLMEIHEDGKGFEMEKMKVSIGHGVANM